MGFDVSPIAKLPNLRGVVPPQYSLLDIAAYNKSLQQTFYVGVAAASLSIFRRPGLELRSVKRKKIERVKEYI
jgi:hypothetical protein